MKRLIGKATAMEWSFKEVLTSVRASPLGNGLPSLADILHRRSHVIRKATPVDLIAVHAAVALQAKYIKQHNKARWARSQRQLVIGE